MSNTWNQAGTTWGSNQWGEQGPTIVTLTGQSATSNVGSLVVERAFVLNAPAATTTSVGSLTINSSQIHDIQGLQAISSVGSISPADVMGLTGQSATSSVGSVDAISSITLTGQSATSSVGSISPAAMTVGLTGQSATSSVGSISPADVMGLTGIQATISVGNVAPLGYQNVDIEGNTSYSNLDITGNTSYTDVTHAA